MIKIEVFGTQKGNSNWVLLPDASKFLTDRQLIPNVGDALTLPVADAQKIGIEKASFEHIQSVKLKWFNYSSSDVAILLHYVPF